MARPDCPQCSGTGWKIVERPDQESGAKPFASPDSKPGVSVGEPKLVWGVPCECTFEDRASSVFARARIPERYRHCDFENFDTDLQYDHASPSEVAAGNRTLEQARVVVQGFARDFPAGTEHGLLLMGPCGVGKTHLAVAAVQEIMRRGHTCLFYDYRELLKEIQNSYNSTVQTTELDVLRPVFETDVLVLDELGAVKPTEWVWDTVSLILNTRYNDNRTTIITTNFDDQPAAAAVGSISPARAASRGETLGDRIGERMRSRLHEMCRIITLEGTDFRQKFRSANFR